MRDRLAVFLLAPGFACTAAHYERAADAEVFPMLEAELAAVANERRASLIEPSPERPEAEPASPDRRLEVEGDRTLIDTLPRNDDGELLVDLQTALEIAVHYNREYKNRQETLCQSGLGLSLARFDFGPQFLWTVGTVWSDEQLGGDQLDYRTDLAVSQILPTGGTLSLTGNLSSANRPGQLGVFNSGVQIALTQPLLRGGGYTVTHEPLTRAERGFVYAVRDFVLFRQDFAIGVANDYFDLLQQREILQNQQIDYDAALFDQQKSEALFQMARVDDQEVFRSRRRSIDTQNRLIDSRVDFQRAVDQFKIRLGIPIDVKLELADEQAEFVTIDIDERSAIEAAQHNRIDLKTQRQQIEDAERAIRIANNGLLPDLDLTASYALNGVASNLAGATPDEWAGAVGIQLEIPLQRTVERNAYRNAVIALMQAQRAYRLTLDQLEVDVQNSIRALKSIERQIQLQEQQIRQETQTVQVNEVRFDLGMIQNRDLIDARQSLVTARNTLVRLKVSHFIGRLRLLRDMGTLFIDPNGMWL